MISLALSAALLAAAPNTADLYASYSKCVEGMIRTKLGEKVDPAAFETQVTSACPAEAAAYKSALVQKELGYGAPQADAEAAANDEVSAYLVDMKKMYRDEYGKQPTAQPAVATTPAPAAEPKAN